MTIVRIAAVAPGRAGVIVGNWDWPVLLLVPLALALALLTALALARHGSARSEPVWAPDGRVRVDASR